MKHDIGTQMVLEALAECVIHSSVENETGCLAKNMCQCFDWGLKGCDELHHELAITWPTDWKTCQKKKNLFQTPTRNGII